MLIHKGCGGEIKEDMSLEPRRHYFSVDGREINICPYICQKCGSEIARDSIHRSLQTHTKAYTKEMNRKGSGLTYGKGP